MVALRRRPQEPSDDDSESQGCSYSILTHNLYSINSKAIIFTVVVIRVYIVITLLNLPFFSSVWYLLPTRWRLRIERAWLIFREAEGHFLHLFLFIFVVTYFFAAIGCRIWGGGSPLMWSLHTTMLSQFGIRYSQLLATEFQ